MASLASRVKYKMLCLAFKTFHGQYITFLSFQFPYTLLLNKYSLVQWHWPPSCSINNEGQLGGAVDRAPVQESGGPEFKSYLRHLTLTNCVTLGKSLNPIASSWVISSHPDEYLVTGFRRLWRRSEAGDLHSPPSLKTKSSVSHVIISLMAWSSSAMKDEHTQQP